MFARVDPDLEPDHAAPEAGQWGQKKLKRYRQEIIDAGRRLVESGVMQISLHGNISARIPGTNRFLLTGGGSIASLRREQIALFELDRTLLEGAAGPTSAEIVDMRSVVYRLRPKAGGVVRTHSPAAARSNIVIEEGAVLALNARMLGEAREIPAAMVALTQSRRDEFAAAGVQAAL